MEYSLKLVTTTFLLVVKNCAISLQDPQLFHNQTESLYKVDSTTPILATNLHGRVVPSLTASETIGPRGEILLQDFVFMEKLASFTRERIPERSVHAKGTGAHGFFQVTHDVSHITRAKFLNEVGKKTPCFCRFSTTVGGRDSADTLVDSHGFACKFYTEDGIHDLLSLNMEPVSLRDPMQFPDLCHSRRKDPMTGQTNWDSWWDFVSHIPESTHHLFHLFSDRGRPDNYRVINGFAVNVFRFANRTNGVVYGKFHWRSEQPFKYLTYLQAEELAGSNPEYKTQDLQEAIAKGMYPSWGLYFQLMSLEQAMNYPHNPLDVTRRWPENKFPLIPVGRLTLNRNPSNQFVETEQVAFAHNNMVPGIHPSKSRMLGGAFFAYMDAQRYRLGSPNYPMLPINRPTSSVNSYIRDGAMCYGDNGGSSPNYFPNSYGGPTPASDGSAKNPKVYRKGGVVDRYDEEQSDDNFDQPRLFLQNEIGQEERTRLVESMADTLRNAKQETRERVLKNNFYPVSRQFGDELRDAVEKALANPRRKSCYKDVINV